MDKTLKLRAYSADTKSDTARGNLAKDQNASLELTKTVAQLEEEKKKSLEYLQTIEQLRESLKLEQARTAEMVKKKTELEAKIKEFSALDSSEIAKKTAQLEEEKFKSLESMKIIVQLRESLRLEQARTAEMIRKSAESESKVKELTEVLGKIASAAAAAKVV